ncbi:uncharacterized protein LOC131437579 [Malaya genurostris]|uniref:uncharacterized protein LOC131437579 n=1 Tax=Malaya genurostris TaxID=325434 RepID=UPI0026F387CC|nr:uncharacterized protein LOC131437579 [Malaya genurostris]
MATYWKIVSQFVRYKLFRFEKDVDYFYYLKPLEKFIGYNMKSWTRRQRLIWFIYVTHLVVMFLDQSVKLYAAAFIEWRDLGYFGGTAGLWWFRGMNLVQIQLIRWTQPEQDRIRAYINARQNRPKDPKAFQKRFRSFRFNVIFALCHLFVYVFNEVVLFVSVVWRKPEYRMYLHLGERHWLASVLTEVNTLVCILVNGGLSSVFTVTLISQFKAMETELEILVDIFETLEKNVHHLLSEQPSGSVNDHLFAKILTTQLTLAVQKQQTFFDFIEQLQKFTKPTLLLYYYYAYGMMALSVMLILYETHSGFYLILVGVAILILAQWWIISRCIENLESMTNEIGDIVYGLPWPTKLQLSPKRSSEYRGTVQLYLLIITRCQRGLSFSCGGFFIMSMENFGYLVNMTYNLLTFLLSFRK